MSEHWRYDECSVAFYHGGIETDMYKVVDALNAAETRIAELSQAVGLITTLKPTMVMDANHPLDMAKEVAEYVTARIAELEKDNHSLGDSNLWLKQNYEDLERDYGVMHKKMYDRIVELEAKVAETRCDEIDTLTTRIAKLKEFINQLIEIGDSFDDGYEHYSFAEQTPALIKFRRLVRNWKEG